mmetsp:Transcript_10994/g.28231  ORF Transcript_10994/g.28231 Transcript_10994/m.28231 type:complete len:208 (+) Transcript_10994:1093-1716(+)
MWRRRRRRKISSLGRMCCASAPSRMTTKWRAFTALASCFQTRSCLGGSITSHSRLSMTNVVPQPGTDSTSSVASRLAAMRSQMPRPRPLAGLPALCLTWAAPWGIPGPESATLTRRQTCPLEASHTLTRTVIPPLTVNLMALDNRLTRICLTPIQLIMSRFGSRSSSSSSRNRSFSLARKADTSHSVTMSWARQRFWGGTCLSVPER